MWRVAAYCRVSTETEEQKNSLRNQREYFEKYIQEHPMWQLVQIYYDEGITGTQVSRRKGFHQMLSDAAERKIDLLLTKEVSRFARNTIDTLYYTRSLKEMGVGIIFITDGIDTRAADGELRLTLMAGLAQEESRKISERVRWGQTQSMEKGIVFGRDLLGYQVKDGKLFLVEEEAVLVRQIFNKYTLEGKGSTRIARELTEEGWKSKQNTKWSSGVILKILKNEKYVGDLCQKKTITLDYITHRKKKNQGEEEKIYIRDHHIGIIERELWERTQAELKRRNHSQTDKRKYSSRYWCSGKFICAECKSSYVRYTKTYKSGGKYVGWRCYGKVKGYGNPAEKEGSSLCGNVSFSEKYLRESIGAEIRKKLSKEKSDIQAILLKRLEKIDSKREVDTEKKQSVIDFLEKVLEEVYDGRMHEETEAVYAELLQKIIVSPERILLEWNTHILFQECREDG